MEGLERTALLWMAQKLADDIHKLVIDRSHALASSDLALADALWGLWDSILDMHRIEREQWMEAGQAAEREDREARDLHPYDYDEWLLEENRLVREMMVKRLGNL